MALNLSTLTSPTTSGDVLAEIANHPQADFLDSVPVLKNVARGPNKGGDAKQTTALNQPKALPVVDGKGYLYLSGVTGNYASVPDPLGALGDFVMEAKDVYMSDWTDAGAETFFAQFGSSTKTFTFRRIGANINFYSEIHVSQSDFAHGLTGAATASIRVTRVGTSLSAELDTGSGYVAIGSAATIGAAPLGDTSDPVEIGSRINGTNNQLLGKISRAVIWDNGTATGTPVLDVDFTATNIPHGAKKFACATGQVVTINQSGNDPATVIKKSVLRFANQSDGSTNIGFDGLFSQQFNGGYMFAALSVLGDGGNSYGYIFATNKTGGDSSSNGGVTFSYRHTSSNNLAAYRGALLRHYDLFDDSNGDILHEHKATNEKSLSKVNNADEVILNNTYVIESDEFTIGKSPTSVNNAAFDLEYLALFPATLSDAEAARVVSWVNRRSIFDFKDGFGYYFYDATKAPVGAISSGSSSWNGRIVGSDNGDVDRYLTQATSSDQPVSDGYKVTFADNTDHLDIPSTTQSGWQICGTSLGTFVYRVNGTTTVTELNLLGNLGHASFRRAGDLYGIILLPETANGKEIEDARQVLINRGASDSAYAGSLGTAWYNRLDIVEFKHIDTSATNSVSYAWYQNFSLTSFPNLDLSNSASFTNAWYKCNSLTSFPALYMSSGGSFTGAWRSCTSLKSFPAIDARNGTNFTSAWQNCSALTDFSGEAKLGTAANNVNFSSAWRSSGLTEIPAGLDLSKGKYFQSSFQGCSSLTSIGTGVLFGTASTGVNFKYTWKSCTNLVTLPADFNLSAGTDFNMAFQSCTSLVDFPAGVFDTMGVPVSNCFSHTWTGCTLSTTSVENILTSIDTSGQSSPAGGGHYIIITYNVSTGALTAATNTAVTSLKSKGWGVIVNNVTL